MAPPTPEAFVARMLQATLHRTGIARVQASDVGSTHQLRVQTQQGDNHSNNGVMILTLRAPADLTGDIVVEYNIWGNGETWNEGTIALYWTSLPRHRSEFFCELDSDDGELKVHHLEVLHKRRVLSLSMQALVDDLGRRSATAVARRLADLKHSPDIDGFCQLIGYVNNVMANFMLVEQPDGSSHYEIEGGRSDDWGVWGRVTSLPKGIIDLAKRFPNQVLVIGLDDTEE